MEMWTLNLSVEQTLVQKKNHHSRRFPGKINAVDIGLKVLGHSFKSKPLLVGGKAKEYYGVRKAGADIDLVVSTDDYLALAKLHPNSLKNLGGDLGVMVEGFEIWKTVCLFDYDFYSQDSIEEGFIKIISIEKLLFMTALAIHKPKYMEDLKLIVNKIIENQGRLSDTVK